MSVIMSKVHATGVYWHFPEFTGSFPLFWLFDFNTERADLLSYLEKQILQK